MNPPRTAIHPSSTRRAPGAALGVSLAVSLAVHLLAVALWPRAVDRVPRAAPQQAPLHARLAIVTPQTPVPAPAAPGAVSGPGPDTRRNLAPEAVTAAVPPSREAPAAPPPPTVDLQAALAAARSIGKSGSAPRELGPPPRSPVTVETVIARAMRPQAPVEERDAGGNWIQRGGGRRCVLAPNRVPHYLQGMAIPVQCEVSTS